MLGRKRKTPPFDIERIVTSAVAAAFGEDDVERGRDAKQDGDAKHNHRLRGAGAVATGAVIAIVARATYKRARNLNLERVAETLESRLQRPSD
jgi:ADP-ribosylglycohydrolase